MELPPRVGSYRQSRRSRSQRDRERKMTGAGGRDPRPYSPSSGSDREAGEAPGSSRPRPPRRRRRESTSCEEDIIDGFAIASYPTLEALEKDAVPKPPERVDSQRKRQEKRKPEENQPSSLCEGARGAEGSEREQNRRNGERNPPPTKKVKTKGPTRGNQSTGGENGSSQRSSSRGAGSDVSAHSSLGTGYFCDIDSDPDDKPLEAAALCHRGLDYTTTQDKALHNVWQRISFVASDDGLSSFLTAATKIASDVNGAVIPKGETKVSGLERSQERNQGSDKDPLLVPSLPAELAPQAAPAAPATAGVGAAQGPAGPQAQPEVAASAPAGSRTPVLPSLSHHHHHHHHHQHHHNLPPQQQHRQSTPARVNPQPKPQTPVQSQPKVQPFSQQQLVYRSGRSSTPSKTLASPSQLPHRASTPSSLTSLGLSSQAASHGFVPALRPSSHPSHPHPGMFTPSPGLPPPPPLTSAMLQVAGHPSPASVAAFSEQELIRQELNSRYLSSQGSERSAALGPPSFQFHQHSHQHQHTHQHTHQHFAPYPTIPQPGLVPAPAPSMVHTPCRNYFQGYHTPVSGIPSVLPPAGPFGSVQGAFQPKTPNPELTSRSGSVPHTLLQKDPRLTEAYRPTIRKPGKWCAMHVQIAWMIYQHQEKNKMIHPDHHKLDFTKTDLLSRNPSSLFGPVTHSHEMARSATLFAAADPGHAASSPFVPPNTLNTFLNPSPHLDPYGRTPAYSAIGQLTNRAFGGLGNAAVAVSTVFAHKDNAAAQSMGHSRDHWNRLHQTPPSFPTPPPAWPRLAEVERERGGLLDKEPDPDQHEMAFIKEEKEREAVYGRHQIRMSPAAHKTGGGGGSAPAIDEERGRPRSSSEPRGPSRERTDPPRDHFKQEHRGREYQPPAEDSRIGAKRPGEDAGKAGTTGREPSPYSRLGAAPEASRPSLLRELAKRHEVKVKEERKEEHDMVAAGPALPGLESAQLQRAHVPGGALHALHPLPVPLAVVGQVNGLGVLERGRLVTGPYLGVGHPGVAPGGTGERLGPYGGWEPFRDPWRGPEVVGPPLPSRYPAAQPRYYEAERAYRERVLLRELVPEALLAEARREQEAGGFLEQPSPPQLLLHEEYDQRARLLGFLGPHPHHHHHHHHHPYPRASPSLVHPAGLLSKTPPMATLGAPPPLISSSSGGGAGRPGSPIPRATPLSASELRDLAAYAQKDRDSR